MPDDRTPTVPCGLCGTLTIMTGTKRCDRCWELEKRVQREPELAARILADVTTDFARDCDHHWHVTERDHSGGTTITRQCCRCGEVVVERLSARPPNRQPWWSTPPGCGPHAPGTPRFEP